jgi:pilus assembly protein Flp/PilA
MLSKIKSFLRNEEGLTAVEYAVAGTLIVVGLVAAFQALGGNVLGIINQITGQLPG